MQYTCHYNANNSPFVPFYPDNLDMADTPESELHAAPDFRKISNNTNKHWWLDPCTPSLLFTADGSRLITLCLIGLRRNIFHCIGLCGTLFFNGCA